MGRILLIVGGVFQALIVALHVWMFFNISSARDLPDAIKPLLHIFKRGSLGDGDLLRLRFAFSPEGTD